MDRDKDIFITENDSGCFNRAYFINLFFTEIEIAFYLVEILYLLED
jgi:hypothetical protein